MSMADLDLANLDGEDKALPFAITTHTYKVVDGGGGRHPILVDVIVPKKLIEKGPGSVEWKTKRPVVVGIHGGWLLGGQREYAGWYPKYIFELAIKHNAIIVYPDYRCLPESRGIDILADIDDFWTWLSKDFEGAVKGDYPGLAGVDLDRTIVSGSSAGGYLATQLVLRYYNKSEVKGKGKEEGKGPRIRALVAVYPMLDLRAPHWSEGYHKPVFGVQDQVPPAAINEHLEKLKAGEVPSVVSNARIHDGGPRMTLALSLVHNGLFTKQLEAGATSEEIKELHAEDQVTEFGATLPPSVFIHGFDDSAVPVAGTDKFVELLKEKKAVEGLKEGMEAREVLKYIRVPGDHGFESDASVKDVEWVKVLVPFVERYWVN